MVCLLQPECNFLHGFLRCKLPVEVVDVEVNITSMQGTHIFRRDRMAQLIKCTPWIMRLHLHPTIMKKMRSYLEVENKMGLIIPAPANQFRPSLLETNPNIRKNNMAEKRKRATPKKWFRPATPKTTATCPPYLKPHQSPRVIHHQHWGEKILHGLAQARCWEIFSRAETGYFQKTTWLLRARRTLMQHVQGLL